MNWKNEWDLQILLDLSFSEKEAGELASILKFDDNDLPDKKGLPDLIFLYDDEYLELWKADKHQPFRNNAIELIQGNQAYVVLGMWQKKVDTIDSWQRRIEQLQISAEERIKQIEINAAVKWGVHTDQISDRLQELELQLNKDEEYWADLSVEDLEKNPEGRERIELDKLASLLRTWVEESTYWQQRHVILRKLVLVKILYEHKYELLQESLREYEATGVIPKIEKEVAQQQTVDSTSGQTIKKKYNFSARMLKRIRLAYQLLSDEEEHIAGRTELNAAIAEKMNSKVLDLVKQLDETIGYDRSVGGRKGNEKRLQLCIVFLQTNDATWLKQQLKSS